MNIEIRSDIMLDDKTISELKILENPKFPQFVKRALNEEEFLDSIFTGIDSKDAPLRKGISTIIVQVSKRKPELLRSLIPVIMARLEKENNKMVRNNISQTLLHLSKRLPQDFIDNGATSVFAGYLRKGVDHECFDALKVLQYVAAVDPKLAGKYTNDVRKIASDSDNPVLKAEAERTLEIL